MKDQIVNMSDHHQKRMLQEHMRSLDGLYRFTIVRYHKRRTDAQNGYYFGVVIPIFADWLRDMGWEIDGKPFTNDDAHDYLKEKFLKIDIHDRNGEVIEKKTGRTSKLTTVQMVQYVHDQCIPYIEEITGLRVPPPDPFYKLKDIYTPAY